MDKKAKIVGILGMHRSGTSALARVLNLLGVDLGSEDQLMPPSNANPEGFWENSEVVNLNNLLLRKLGMRWDSTCLLFDDWKGDGRIYSLKHRLGKYLKEQIQERQIWGWKDPRTCLLLPVWNEAIEAQNADLRYVFIYRNPYDVASSLMKRDGFGFDESLELWTFYNMSALYGARFHKMTVLSYEKLLEDPLSVARMACNRLGLVQPGLDTITKIESFIKPTLDHGNKGNLNNIGDLPLLAQKIYEMLVMMSSCSLESLEFSKAPIESLYHEYCSAHTQFSLQSLKSECQIYLSDNKEFKGDFSASSTMEIGNFSTLNFEMGISDRKFDLRIDPSDMVSLVQITNIQITYLDDARNPLKLIVVDKNTDYSDLDILHDVLIMDRLKEFTFISTGNDPQLIIRNLYPVAGASSINIKIHQRVCTDLDDEAVSRLFLKVEYEKKDREEQIVSMDRQMNILSNTLENTQDSLRMVDKELRTTRESLCDEIVHLKNANQNINRILNLTRTELLEAIRNLEKSESERDFYSNRVDESNRVLLELQMKLLTSQNRYYEILQSKSWRITKPARRFMNIFKREGETNE